MKKTILAAATAAAFGLFADDAYQFVTVDNANGYGYSYIQINQNLDSFKFDSDWHSLGNAGQIGYVVYSSDMSAGQMAAHMEHSANPPDPEFRKSVNGGTVDLGSLKAGDRVGFYEVRPDGGVYTLSAFKEWKDKTWLAFDKNDGNGKDEWMSIENVSATAVSAGGGSGGTSADIDIPGGSSGGGSPGGHPKAPAGAPLPGALAALLVGGFGAGAMKFRKRR